VVPPVGGRLWGIRMGCLSLSQYLSVRLTPHESQDALQAHNMEADVMAVGDPDFTAAEEEGGDAASFYMEVLNCVNCIVNATVLKADTAQIFE